MPSLFAFLKHRLEPGGRPNPLFVLGKKELSVSLTDEFYGWLPTCGFLPISLLQLWKIYLYKFCFFT